MLKTFSFLCALLFCFNSSFASAETSPEAPSKSWAGDLRYRVHAFKDGVNDQRIFQQIRARLAYRADIEDNLSATLRLATGSSAISANQDIGDRSAPGMQRRPFNLDLAYLDYRPLANTHGYLGKTPNPFYASANNQLMFDADIDFEGVSAKWAAECENVSYFVNAGTSMISENYGTPAGVDTPDTALLGAQAGGSVKVFGTFTAALAAYHYLNVQGRPTTNVAPTTSLISATGRFGGNSLNGTTMASEFQIYQITASWKHVWGEYQTELYYDALQNSVAKLGGSAYEGGVVVKHGPWSVTYALVFKEADSTLGAFSDSDSNGGGTDNNGGRANVSYQISKSVSASITDFRAKRNISAATPTDFGDTMVDLSANF